MQNLSSEPAKHHTTEILISAFRVTHPLSHAPYHPDTYEFVLNDDMHLVECFKILVPTQGIRKNLALQGEVNYLENVLFELQHVRVNPKKNNTHIIQRLILALNDIGVSVQSQPSHQDMQLCYKPLGEIEECVRFYLTGSRKIIFLCPTKGPRLMAYGSNV